MKKVILSLFLGLFLVFLSGAIAFGQGETEDIYTIWVGGHYTDFTDYNKKVGEYMYSKEEILPEFKIDYLSRGKGYVFSLNGYYYDRRNIFGTVTTRHGDRFAADFKFKSTIHHEGQDLLQNLETREAGGGKILTHEILDPGADYNSHRREIEGHVKALISKKNNIKMMVSHRTVLQSGTEQALSNNHCLSCHIV